MKYKIEFNYRYGKDYVYCNEYRDGSGIMTKLLRGDAISKS